MKNIILKLFIGLLSTLPMYGQAAYDCGGGTIKYVRSNAMGEGYFTAGVNWLQDFPKLNGSNYWHDGTVLVHVEHQDAKLSVRNDIVTAFHSGSVVRFFNLIANDCSNINEVLVCTDKTSCKAVHIF